MTVPFSFWGEKKTNDLFQGPKIEPAAGQLDREKTFSKAVPFFMAGEGVKGVAAGILEVSTPADKNFSSVQKNKTTA